MSDEGIRLYKNLNQLKEKGITENIGVSLYNGDEIDIITNSFIPDIVQLPLNILDQRLMQSGHIEKLKSLGVKVHVRSVFLQGLFHMTINELPDYFQPIRSILLKINNQAKEQGLSINQAALNFVRDQPYIDNILIGIESLMQLNCAIDDFSLDCSFNSDVTSVIDDKFLNPTKWSSNSDS
jgi:aryl-alcohol dehydrogenase-like predicted oxidoreductase